MCGIIASFSKTTKIKSKNKKKAVEVKATDVNKFIIEQYEDQCGRGQKGFGIIRIDDKKNKIEIDRATEPMKFMLDLYLKPSTMIIAHHRQPTSTDNYMDQTHPMEVKNKMLKYDYYVIHNGIIGNDKELHEKHMELGFTYTTEYREEWQHNQGFRTKFNDSEALAIELALFIEGKITAIGIDNSAAYIALQVEKETGIATKVFFGRNGMTSDLRMAKTRGSLKISSTGPGNEIKEGNLYSFEVKDPTMNLKSKKITFARIKIEKKEEEKKPTETEKTTPTTTPGLPFSQVITAKEYTKEEAKDTAAADKREKMEDTRMYRSWIDESSPIEDIPLGPDKNYAEEMLEEVKDELKDQESDGIPIMIDALMQDELDKINEILSAYKDILLSDKLGNQERGYFVQKIAQIMKAMNMVVDAGEEEYDNKKKEEIEKELEDYNTGFFPKAAKNIGFKDVCKSVAPYEYLGNDDYDDYDRHPRGVMEF